MPFVKINIITFSPTRNNLNADLLALIEFLASLIMVELTAPQSPLSDVIGTNNVLLILNCGYLF